MKANEYEWQKKPVIIEAWKLDTEALHTMPLWLAAGLDKDVNYAGAVRVLTSMDDNSIIGMSVFTMEGVMTADAGDYIIRGVKGEIYPCKPDIFEATYERPGGEDEPELPLRECANCAHYTVQCNRDIVQEDECRETNLSMWEPRAAEPEGECCGKCGACESVKP